MSLNALRIASAVLLASFVFIPAAVVTTPAAAADDDVICFDYPLPGGGEETECGTVGDYKAECKLTDPDNTSEFCQDVNTASIWRPNQMVDSSRSDDGGNVQIDVPSSRPQRG